MPKIHNKTFITGGFGFVGYHLAANLLARGENVILFGHRPKDDKKFRDLQKQYFDMVSGKSRLNFRYGDILEQDLHRIIHEEPDIAMVYHLAAMKATSATAGTCKGDMLVHNYDTDMCVLDFCELVKAHKTEDGPVKLIYVSTGEVYGEGFTGGVPMRESMLCEIRPNKPEHIYPLTKLMGEALLIHGEWSFQWNIVRLQNPYGPGMGMDMLIPKLMVAAIEAAEKGSGKFLLDYPMDYRPYVYIADAAEALGAIMDLGRHAETYNVAGLPIPMNEVAHSVVELFALGKLVISATSIAGTKKLLDCSKVFDDVGWRATTNLYSGLRPTFEWVSRTRAIARVVNGAMIST